MSNLSSVAVALDRVTVLIAHYRQEFERFWGGDRSLPPDDVRAQIEALLHGLRVHGTRTVQDGYRLSNLEAQVNTYGELFNRRLREREEGRRNAPARRPARAPERPPSPPARTSETRRGITMAKGEAPSRDALEVLYRDLYPAGERRTDAPPVELERFGRYLADQAESIRQRTGCEAVQFRVAVEEGRAKLKARPVGSTS